VHTKVAREELVAVDLSLLRSPLLDTGKRHVD
jgi:hypothetical protein